MISVDPETISAEIFCLECSSCHLRVGKWKLENGESYKDFIARVGKEIPLFFSAYQVTRETHPKDKLRDKPNMLKGKCPLCDKTTMNFVVWK